MTSLMPTLRAYKCDPPDGKPFMVRIDAEGESGFVVMSNRNGKWERETKLTAADLVMPEQNFSEWDIVPIDVSKTY